MTSRGFTLLELVVAIAIMGLITVMAWRGLDGMASTKQRLHSRQDTVHTLQAGLAQWKTDLDQMVTLRNAVPWDWDGQVMRISRAAGSGAKFAGAATDVQVVGYTWRADALRPGGGDWQRWQSLPLGNQEDWETAWEEAARWGHAPAEATQGSALTIHPLAGWQLFLNQDGNWHNPFSSDDPTRVRFVSRSLPNGVRLVLTLPPGPAGEGPLTVDWMSPEHE